MFYARQHDFGQVQGLEVGLGPTGKPIKSVFLYKVGSVVIDTGPRHLRTRVNAWLDDDTVTTILLTHHHEDHSGNGGASEKPV